MKKILLILLCFPFIGFGQSFNDGWKEGYKKGYCGNDLSCVEPIPPIAPASLINMRSHEVSEYQFGYNEGFKRGIYARSGRSYPGSSSGESSRNLLDNHTKIKQQEIKNSNKEAEFYRNQTAENERQINQNIQNIAAAQAQQRAANMGWRKINETRFTYTYVPATGLVGMKKLKKRALKEVENQSLINGWDYEVVQIIEQKVRVGVLPKCTVVIELK